MSDGRDEPNEALDHIAYLSRSTHRVAVLEALTESIPDPGRPRTGYDPRALQDLTGASEATISRILSGFADRGWAERNDDGEYVATAKGQSIAMAFAPSVDAMVTVQRLGDAVTLLPFSELSIGLHHFRDATVREPEGPQPADFGQYLSELLDGASTYRFISYVPGPPNVEAMPQLDQVGVFADYIIDYLGGSWDHEYYGEGPEVPIDMYSYDGHMSCNLFIIDELVAIENSQVDGISSGTTIESRNETVREWAIELFERYRKDAEYVESEDATV